MLNRLFSAVLNMSLTASYVIAVVLLLRALFKLLKLPNIFSYALWSVVLFRLLFPFSLESACSLPALQGLSVEQIAPLPTQFTALSTLHHPSADLIRQFSSHMGSTLPAASTDSSFFAHNLFACIWLTGMLLLLLHSLRALHKLKRQLRPATRQRDNIFLLEGLDTAFVFGIFRPKIYLPTGLGEAETRYILLHEQTHLKRFDPLLKCMSNLLLCVHWFNPLVWVAFTLSGRDMELSCDERVLAELGTSIKKDYSTSLLTGTGGSHHTSGMPLAFAEGELKARIQNVLRYQKPAFWLVLTSSIVVLAVCISLATNPRTNSTTDVTQPDWVADLYQFRTPYIGNASKVGNLCGQLPILQNLEHKGMRLQTTEPPYALHLNFATGGQAPPNAADELVYFRYHAVILFSLIENLDVVRLVVDDTEFLVWTREQAEIWMGEPLWEASKTVEGFRTLLADFPSRYGILSSTYVGDFTQTILREQMQTILSAPLNASNVQDYIALHPAAFHQILSYGSDALLYAFSRFEQGGQSGLEGQLLMQICQTLCTEEESGFDAPNGQIWYDTFKENAVELEKTLDAETLKKEQPSTWLLLSYLNGSFGGDDSRPTP